KRLRESLGAAAAMVETVRGAGYRLTAQITA
ncbi:MAG: DNA-binding response regulator, partial [Comamonadaceae bacterium]